MLPGQRSITEQITAQKTYYELDLTLFAAGVAEVQLDGQHSEHRHRDGHVVPGRDQLRRWPDDLFLRFSLWDGGHAERSGEPGIVSGLDGRLHAGGDVLRSNVRCQRAEGQRQRDGRLRSAGLLSGWLVSVSPAGNDADAHRRVGRRRQNLWIAGTSGTVLSSSGGAWLPSANPWGTNQVSFVRGTNASNVYASGSSTTTSLMRWDGKVDCSARTAEPDQHQPSGYACDRFERRDAERRGLPSAPTKYLIYRFNGTTYSSIGPTLGPAVPDGLWGLGGNDVWAGSSLWHLPL